MSGNQIFDYVDETKSERLARKSQEMPVFPIGELSVNITLKFEILIIDFFRYWLFGGCLRNRRLQIQKARCDESQCFLNATPSWGARRCCSLLNCGVGILYGEEIFKQRGQLEGGLEERGFI